MVTQRDLASTTGCLNLPTGYPTGEPVRGSTAKASLSL